MKYWVVALIAVLVVLSAQLEARAESWRGLQPLHSTRSDVERVLQVKSSGKEVDLFELKDWKVWLRYTNATCAQEALKTRDSSNDLVTLISLIPKKRLYLDVLKVDLSNFKKTYVRDVANAYILSSEELGFAVHTNDQRLVAGLEYHPSAEDRKSRCPEN